MSDTVANSPAELMDIRFQSGAKKVYLESIEGGSVSGGELVILIARVREGLRRAGVSRQHRIGLVAPPSVETVTAVLSLLGECAFSLLDPTAPAERLAAAAEELKLDGLMVIRGKGRSEQAAASGLPVFELETEGGTAAGLRVAESGWTLPAPRKPATAAALFLTSGTEGAAKVVPLSNGNLAASMQHIGAAMELGAEDRFLCMARMHHIAGLALVLAALAADSTVVVAPGFHGAAFVEWLERFRPTWFWAAPAMLREAVNQVRKRPEGLAGVPLRLIRVGSAPLPPALGRDAEELFGVPVLETYGMTEASPQITCSPLPPRVRKAGSAGPAAGPELRIVNEQGGSAAAGEVGQISVRGANVIAGYEGDAGRWEKRFEQGWFYTGDLGYLDEDGYLFVTGRLGEVINRGGVKVSPRLVEEKLLEHASVEEAAVFGVAHPTLGQEAYAMVVPRPGVTARSNELRAWLSARLPADYVPAEILVRYEIPKDSGGKVRRSELGATFAGAFVQAAKEDGGGHRAPSTPTERRVEEMWREVLRIGQAGADDDFFELGGDSFAAALLWTQIQDEFQLREAADRIEFVSRTTIAGQAAVIEELLRSRGESSELHPCLAPLQRRGTKLPLFIVPLAAEMPEYYRRLTRGVEPDTPVYALFDPEPLEKRGFVTVEGRAELFLEAVRSVQPHGPYRLFGDCFGGTVAYEMAMQLKAAGEEVSKLILFDSGRPGYPSLLRHPYRLLLGAMHMAGRSIRNGHSGDLKSLAASFYRKSVLGPAARIARGLGLEAGKVYRVEGLYPANVRALNMYRPKPYEGEVHLLLSKDHLQTGTVVDRRLGWCELIRPRPAVRVLEGSRGRLYGEPDNEVLAAAVAAVCGR
ncbi:MAG: AMP-binding protein [Acidobacteria bacterium]|nr:AMP-binding protein [Acidobacteriota bacterium]